VVGAGAGFGLGALSGLVVFGFSHAGADCMERGPCPWRLGDYVVTGGVVGSIVGLAAGATVGIVLVATAPAQPEVSLAPTPGGLQTKLRLHF
jgi:hypothetical protein